MAKNPKARGNLGGHSSLFYLRLLLGFAGLVIILAGSLFLIQDLHEDRFSGHDPATFALLIFNTSVFCVIVWKICQKYRPGSGQ